ncbi:MAG: zinc-binding dehydrogenase [Clostridiales Family XIII bacterium]|jgi:NADPH:quinone reductase-like Zn-dependent oxidoreductase|nr:zinc-binding dehydrogenase [Clostridiales Family XIII bacterium]
MEAIVLEKKGSLEGLSYVKDRPVPVPSPGYLRVKVEAVGLNPVDYKLAEGWGDVPWPEPPVLGLDVAGIVDALGDGVSKFSVGDRVYFHGWFADVDGGYAEYACAPEYAVAYAPEALSAVDLASIPCAGFTAWLAINEKLRVREGSTILIHAGAGGVGAFAIQLAKLKGLKIFSTCSKKNVDYVKSMGADVVIDYNSEDVTEAVLQATDRQGVDYIVNTVDGVTSTQDLGRLAFNGELAAVVENPDFSELEFYANALSIHQIALGGAHGSNNIRAKNLIGRMGEEYAALMLQGKVKPLSVEVIGIEDIPDALARMKQRHVAGKIVAVPKRCVSAR